MTNENYKVYVHINKTNGKKYVGITKQDVKRRWQNGYGYHNANKSSYLWNAIQKYGWDGFEHIVLLSELNHEEANEKERYYIELYNSNNPDYGYNLTKGGDGFLGMNRTEETKKKISNSLKGKYTKEKSYWYGKNLPKETIEKIKETKRKKQYHHTEEWKKQHSEDLKGSNNPNSIPVICVETKKVFPCAVDGAKYYKTDNSQISKCCKGKAKTAGKHPETGKKLHWMYYNDYLKTGYDKENPRTEIEVFIKD